MSYLILWEFIPREGKAREFEAAYGPDGPWAGLFREGAGFQGSELWREGADARRYLTMDRWSSRAAFETFRAQFHVRYEALDRQMEHLISQEAYLGSFLIAGPEAAR